MSIETHNFRQYINNVLNFQFHKLHTYIFKTKKQEDKERTAKNRFPLATAS